MDEVRSKIAQYIAGEVKLDQLIDSHRISLPVQKRFKFDDTWITMNRKIGEAVMVENVNEGISTNRPVEKKLWKPSAIQERRRNAVTVQNMDNRLMTNGCTWPTMEDWVVAADKKIRYAPLLQPVRKLNDCEWNMKETTKTSANGSPEELWVASPSNSSDNSSHVFSLMPESQNNYVVDPSS